jgi:hypothetical protein
MIVEYVLSVTTTGSAGSASGNNTLTEPPNGLLVGMQIDAAGMPATTDWTFAYINPAVTLFVLTDYNTSGWVVPFVPAYTLAGVAISGVGAPIPINRVIKLSLAQADAGTAKVRFFIQQLNG